MGDNEVNVAEAGREPTTVEQERAPGCVHISPSRACRESQFQQLGRDILVQVRHQGYFLCSHLEAKLL